MNIHTINPLQSEIKRILEAVTIFLSYVFNKIDIIREFFAKGAPKSHSHAKWYNKLDTGK